METAMLTSGGAWLSACPGLSTQVGQQACGAASTGGSRLLSLSQCC